MRKAVIKRRKRGEPKKGYKITFTIEKINELTSQLKVWRLKDQEHYWLGSFALEAEISSNRIADLANSNEDFRRELELAKDRQKQWLVLGALNKQIDTTMAIFALKNVAGWRDRQEDKNNGKELNTHLTFIQNVIHKMEIKNARDNETDGGGKLGDAALAGS